MKKRTRTWKSKKSVKLLSSKSSKIQNARICAKKRKNACEKVIITFAQIFVKNSKKRKKNEWKERKLTFSTNELRNFINCKLSK